MNMYVGGMKYMTKVMAVNAGSSSLKFQLFNMPSEDVITSGIVERIGMEDAIFTIKYNGEKKTDTCSIPDHQVAVDMLLKALVEEGVVQELSWHLYIIQHIWLDIVLLKMHCLE